MLDPSYEVMGAWNSTVGASIETIRQAVAKSGLPITDDQITAAIVLARLTS